MRASLTVIVPTVAERAGLLGELVDSVCAQLDATDRLVISFDGVPAEGEAGWAAHGLLGDDRIRVLAQSATGPGGARNRGLRQTDTELVLFLNDDVVPEPKTLDAHRKAHENRAAEGLPQALLVGSAPFEAVTDATVLDDMVASTSLIFFYDQMQDGVDRDLGFRHAWTLNLSLPRSIALRFDERLRWPMFDDLEWAFRIATTTGATVRHLPDAGVVHRHRYTPLGVLRREVLLGHQLEALRSINPACASAVFGDRYRSEPTEDEIDQAAAFFRSFAESCSRPSEADPAAASELFGCSREWRDPVRALGAAAGRSGIPLQEAVRSVESRFTRSSVVKHSASGEAA